MSSTMSRTFLRSSSIVGGSSSLLRLSSAVNNNNKHVVRNGCNVWRTTPTRTSTRSYCHVLSSSMSSSVISVDTPTLHQSTAMISHPVNGKTQQRRFASEAMKDEYGAMDDSGETFTYPGNYVLESGEILPNAQLRYQTYGELNAERDNILVVCHALTGNASLHAWWGELLGDGCAFDTSKYFVVCCNILGSCYGSTSPISINPKTNQVYGLDFPDVSVQDTVRLMLTMLRDEIKAKSIKCVIGGSFGGMQTVEFGVQAGIRNGDFCMPDSKDGKPFLRSMIPIACGAQHTAWQIAVSEVQRQAIYRDPAWKKGDHFNATTGLEVARQLGMVSYRTANGYVGKFGRETRAIKGANGQVKPSPKYGSNANWQVKTYLEYQGKKFLSRFDPVTYVKMTEQMDSHDIARGRAEHTKDVLKHVSIPSLVLGIDSDVLYPLYEQKHLASMLPNSTIEIIHSEDGHDGFLLEQDQVARHIIDFMDRHE